MTDFPFGFSLPGGGKGPDPNDPQFAAFVAQLQQILSSSSGPVNWDLARQVATSLAREGDRSLTATERTEVDDALRLADHWLDPVTSLPSGVTTAAGWSRLEWIETTIPTWQKLCDPVAAKVVEAMGTLLPEAGSAELGPLAGLAGAGGLAGMLGGIGGMMFGGQVGQGLGTLSAEVLSATEIGLPLGPAGVGALLPQNLAEFTEGLERPADEVRLYVALREAAHHRLYEHVSWLRGHVLAAVDAYARGITVDRQAFEDAMQRFDPSDPESHAGSARRRHVRAGGHARAAARAGPSGDGVGAGRGVGRARRGRRRDRPPDRCGRIGRDVPPPACRGRSGRADVRHARRPGAPAAPAARGRHSLGHARRAPRRRRARRRAGRTPTSSRPPRISTTRRASRCARTTST